MNRQSLFGLEISTAANTPTVIDEMAVALRDQTRGWLVTFVNPHAWFIRDQSPGYDELLGQFDFVLADGIGVVKAMEWVNGARIDRMSFDGSSLYEPVFEKLSSLSARVYLVGGVDGVALRAMERMQSSFPKVIFVGCSDGYQPRDKIVRNIMETNAQVVLCGMGAPRQEAFLVALKEQGFNGVGFTCGGFLDQLAESPQYYPPWIDRAQLRWAFRIYKEPRRLWRRYAFQYRPFIRSTLIGLWKSWRIGYRYGRQHETLWTENSR